MSKKKKTRLWKKVVINRIAADSYLYLLHTYSQPETQPQLAQVVIRKPKVSFSWQQCMATAINGKSNIFKKTAHSHLWISTLILITPFFFLKRNRFYHSINQILSFYQIDPINSCTDLHILYITVDHFEPVLKHSYWYIFLSPQSSHPIEQLTSLKLTLDWSCIL